jgi:hypothetical protein
MYLTHGKCIDRGICVRKICQSTNYGNSQHSYDTNADQQDFLRVFHLASSSFFFLFSSGKIRSGKIVSSNSTATTLMAFIFGLLGFTLYLQSVVAAASDNYITRSIRFASGVFVPVIGSMLGDASRTVIASVSVVKGTVGASGVVIILSAVLPPLIMVAFHKLLLLSCAIIAKTLSCERESAFLYDMCGIINMLLALVAGAGAVCIIAMAVFVKSGVKV